jgi:hypothetical protein
VTTFCYCMLVVDIRVVSGLLDEYIMERCVICINVSFFSFIFLNSSEIYVAYTLVFILRTLYVLVNFTI